MAPELISLDTIRTLVGFDTTSRESNLALIEWVRAYLESHGVGSTLTFDDSGAKANLFATLPARDGNATHGGVVLSVRGKAKSRKGLRTPKGFQSLAVHSQLDLCFLTAKHWRPFFTF